MYNMEDLKPSSLESESSSLESTSSSRSKTKKRKPTSTSALSIAASATRRLSPSMSSVASPKKKKVCKEICDVVRPTIQFVHDRVLEISETYFDLPKDKNKGKAGSYLESLTGIPTSSACLDCLDGEVKVFPIKETKKCDYVPKETIAVTMLSKESLRDDAFENSRCFKKLTKVLYIPYLREGDRIIYLRPTIIDLTHPFHRDIFEQLKIDYEELRTHFINTGTLDGTSGIGKYLQNRTKGAGGDAPKTRAYYLRPAFMKDFVPITLSSCMTSSESKK